MMENGKRGENKKAKTVRKWSLYGTTCKICAKSKSVPCKKKADQRRLKENGATNEGDEK
jgi:hypothetical protein